MAEENARVGIDLEVNAASALKLTDDFQDNLQALAAAATQVEKEFERVARRLGEMMEKGAGESDAAVQRLNNRLGVLVRQRQELENITNRAVDPSFRPVLPGGLDDGPRVAGLSTRQQLQFELFESTLAQLSHRVPGLRLVGSERLFGSVLRQSAEAGEGPLSTFGRLVGSRAGMLGVGALGLAGLGVATNRVLQPARRESQITDAANEMREGFAAVFGTGTDEAREFAESLRRTRIELDPMTDSMAELGSEVSRLVSSGLSGIDAALPSAEEVAALMASVLQTGIGFRLAGASRGDAAAFQGRFTRLATAIAGDLPGGAENLDEASEALRAGIGGSFEQLAEMGIVVDRNTVMQERNTEQMRALAETNAELADQLSNLAAIEKARADTDVGNLPDNAPEGFERRTREATASTIARAAGARVRDGITEVVAQGGGVEEAMAVLEEMQGAVDQLGTEGAALELLEEVRRGSEGAVDALALFVEAMVESGDAVVQNGHLVSTATDRVILYKTELDPVENILLDVADATEEHNIALETQFNLMQRQQRIARLSRESLGTLTDALRAAREALSDYLELSEQPFTPPADPEVVAEMEKNIRDADKALVRAQEDASESLADIYDTRNETLADANEQFTEQMEDLADSTEDAMERVLNAFKAQDRIDLGSVRNRSASFLINNARRQNELIAEAQAGRTELQERGLSEAAIRELGLDQMTPEAVAQIRLLLQGTDEQLTELTAIFGEKGELAKNELMDPLSEMGEELAERQADILEAHTEAIEDINERFKRAIDQFVEYAADAGLTIPTEVRALDDGEVITIDLPQAGQTLDPSLNDPDAVQRANLAGGVGGSAASGPSMAERNRVAEHGTVNTYHVTVQAQDPAELERKLQERQALSRLTGGGHIQ